MRALVELRDPVAVAFAAGAALIAIWLGHGLLAIGLAILAVLLTRVVAGVVLRDRPRAPAAFTAALPQGQWYAPLTRREADVAVLIRDSTNKEIAERLVLSERTIDNHVANIMNKLDLHHRAQIAAWVAERSRDAAAKSRETPL
jgi:DNA-binding NarL/FixJ family response regulator